MTRSVALISAAALGLTASGAGVAQEAASASAGSGKVVIAITNLRNTKGVIRACMTTNADVFPRCREDPASHRTVVDAGENVTLTFNGVKPGRYSVALLHDENDNGKADRALLGMMPKEGFGFSKDAPVRMGPPSFDDAAFDFSGGKAKLSIKMRYML
ncbi:DUF2141 domain-containing protein [Altererythrobacter lutimaris]|uniref:DUF2141 domain-containing protein n=1 Tax=Altererythrobacter lutimaris TaxID=2743979 RepID=A0A850HD83_9SPHN|nr:DUF2141 domain-containing protein [Altererythrobacter lutimaris]NVE95325.1 DUF2141 domain-containing protein [Altererythrobacter lutimaris]